MSFATDFFNNKAQGFLKVMPLYLNQFENSDINIFAAHGIASKMF